MTQPILKSNTSKILWAKRSAKDISLTVHKGEVISIIGAQEAENQPSFVQLIYSKHLQRRDSLSRRKCLRKRL